VLSPISCGVDTSDDNNSNIIRYDDNYPVIVDIMLSHEELIRTSNLIIAVVRCVDIVGACIALSVLGGSFVK